MLLFSLPLFSIAQITVSASSHTVMPDEVFEVDVTTSGFDDIVGCQFSVEWDTLAFEYLGVTNLNGDLQLATSNFSDTTFTNLGQLGFLWFDAFLQGTTLEDNVLLFSIQLKTIQVESGETQIVFGDMPTTKEISNSGGNVLTGEYEPGIITIDGISDLLEQNASEYVQISSNPNPFRGNTNITIECMKATKAQISLYDPAGKICHSRNIQLLQGTHTLELPDQAFSQAGTYLLKINGTDFISTYKLIAIK
jgi:hypothetical protein